jgi:tRNA 2-thiouridine synthesizing protein A
MSETPKSDAVLDSPGTACAYLTPMIKESIAPLATGQVLEVVSDDPASRQGVPAWSRMTGNPLIACVTDGENSRFYLRKK